MTSLPFFQQIAQEDLDFPDKKFREAENQLKSLLFDKFNRKIDQKQLYFQNRYQIKDLDKTYKKNFQDIPSNTKTKNLFF